jgi:putative thiamine transport system permease protein
MLWLLYIPLLVPQIAFLFGAQMLLVRLNFDGTWPALIWAHLLFVFPYVFLALADPWRAFDPRYRNTALALTGSRLKTFFRVELPMMLKPVLFAFAIGFAVSVGQYLSTIFAGGGRFTTLTVEAVTLSTGNDRRIIGIYALAQTALPLLVYGLAIVLPAFLQRRQERGVR